MLALLWKDKKISGDVACRRYEKAQKQVAAFEADIRRHRDIIEDIMSESPSEAIKFLHVDCAPLKQVTYQPMNTILLNVLFPALHM